MIETWLPIAGYGDCYSVSNLGLVKRTSPRNIKRSLVRSRAKPFAPSGCRAFINKGYFQVRIGPTGHQKTVGVHILVARAFVPNPDGLPQVNHRDCNKQNNLPENLEWVTHQGNVAHAKENGLMRPAQGEKHPNAKLTNAGILKIRADARLQRLIAEEYGVTQTCISAIKRGLTWSHVA